MGHRFRTVLLLRPPENRSPEGVAPDEPGEKPLELAPRQIRPESFVDKIAQIRGDVLPLRRLDGHDRDARLHGGRGLLSDDSLLRDHAARRTTERLSPTGPP